MLNFRIGKYADVRVDFAFKRCFGCEEHKAATIGIVGYILLRNSGELECRPGRIQGVEFDEFLTAAEIAAYSRNERIRYEKDMVTKQDMHNAIEFAKQEGRREEIKGL